jgi:hypothetical protein
MSFVIIALPGDAKLSPNEPSIIDEPPCLTVPFGVRTETMKQKSSTIRELMKNVATAALLLGFVAAAANAQPGQVNMTVSGTAVNSTVNLQPATPASEYHLEGNGNLGPFTLRVINGSGAPQQSSTCSGSTKLYIPSAGGAAVARFENGDVLKFRLTGGNDCIDFLANQAACTRVFQIIGGTGRFNNTSGGTVTLTMTVVPVLVDGSNNPVFFAITGVVTGSF